MTEHCINFTVISLRNILANNKPSVSAKEEWSSSCSMARWKGTGTLRLYGLIIGVSCGWYITDLGENATSSSFCRATSDDSASYGWLKKTCFLSEIASTEQIDTHLGVFFSCASPEDDHGMDVKCILKGLREGKWWYSSLLDDADGLKSCFGHQPTHNV
jgi:hypothetical protein